MSQSSQQSITTDTKAALGYLAQIEADIARVTLEGQDTLRELNLAVGRLASEKSDLLRDVAVLEDRILTLTDTEVEVRERLTVVEETYNSAVVRYRAEIVQLQTEKKQLTTTT